MGLDLEHLKTYVAVIDSGTFEAAATSLRITPSAVSQRIKALETSTGRVLIRRTKPATPTDSGEVVLRLARQVVLLEGDAVAALGGRGDCADGRGAAGDGTIERTRVPIVVNADSLATWMLPALAEMPARFGASFDVYREDEEHSIELLRNGTAMAAVTASAQPVQGCSVHPLGRMRYRPMASATFAATWFGEGVDATSFNAASFNADAFARAPLVAFDRKDTLQDRYLRRRTRRRLDPPRHYIPASADFAVAVRLGLGWGMLPEFQSAPYEESGQLVPLEPGEFIDVPLYWQRWKLDSPLLAALSETVERAAMRSLRAG